MFRSRPLGYATSCICMVQLRVRQGRGQMHLQKIRKTEGYVAGGGVAVPEEDIRCSEETEREKKTEPRRNETKQSKSCLECHKAL